MLAWSNPDDRHLAIPRRGWQARTGARLIGGVEDERAPQVTGGETRSRTHRRVAGGSTRVIIRVGSAPHKDIPPGGSARSEFAATLNRAEPRPSSTALHAIIDFVIDSASSEAFPEISLHGFESPWPLVFVSNRSGCLDGDNSSQESGVATVAPGLAASNTRRPPSAPCSSPR